MTHRHMTVAALAAAGALTLSACGTGSSNDNSGSSGSSSGSGGGGGQVAGGPGIDTTAKTIHITSITALSGPASALGIPALAGAKTALKAINAAGGVDGYKIKMSVKDTGYVPQNHVQAYKATVGDSAMIQSFGSPTTKAIQPLFDREGIVVQPLSWDSVWSKDPNLAPVGVPYATDVKNGLDYLSKEKKLGTKVGIVYQDDEYGADGLRGYKEAVKAGGLDDVAQAPFKVGDTDFTAQVQKLKSKGAQIVVVTALPSASAPIVGTAASLGYNPTYLFQGPAWLEQIFTKDGTKGGKPTPVAGALAKQTYVLAFAAPWGSDVPGMAQMLADQKQYAPKQIPSEYFTFGYAQGKIIGAILKKAVENGDLSRAGILKAKESLGSVDLGGLAPSPDYTSGGSPVSTKSIIARVDKGTTGFLKPVASGVTGQ